MRVTRSIASSSKTSASSCDGAGDRGQRRSNALTRARSSSVAKGFVRQPSAPLSRATMRSPTASRPVSMRIGTVQPEARIRRVAASPSSTGMVTSISTRSGRPPSPSPCTRTTASRPSPASTVSYPSYLRTRPSPSRTAASSSASRIFRAMVQTVQRPAVEDLGTGCGQAGARGRASGRSGGLVRALVRRRSRCPREADRGDRAACRVLGRGEGDLAARLLDRAGHDGEAEAGARQGAGAR